MICWVQLIKFCFALCCEHEYTEIAEQLTIVIRAHKHSVEQAREAMHVVDKARKALRIAAEEGVAQRAAVETLTLLCECNGRPPRYPQ